MRQGGGDDVKASDISVQQAFCRILHVMVFRLLPLVLYPGQGEGLTLINHQELISGKKKAMPSF